MAHAEPTPQEIESRKGPLLGLFDRLLPIVDALVGSVRLAALLGLVMVVWIFVWMTRFGDFQLSTALSVCAAICLPLLVLLWYWWGLEGLKKLPENVAQIAGNASDEVRSHIQSGRAGEKKKRVSLISLGKLWELRSLADEAGELLGSYARVGTLVNPLLLVLLFLSLLYLAPLGMASLVLAALALF